MAANTKLAKMGSFRYSFSDKRERLLSMKGHSHIGINIPESDEEEARSRRRFCSYRAFVDGIIDGWKALKRITARAWEMGHNDPRKEQDLPKGLTEDRGLCLLQDWLWEWQIYQRGWRMGRNCSCYWYLHCSPGFQSRSCNKLILYHLHETISYDEDL